MLYGQPKGRGVGRPPKPYSTTTLRDFNGGWNVIDNELNLSPKFARIFDNVVRGADGSVSVRFGSRLWADFKLGTVESKTFPGGASNEVFYVLNSRRVQFRFASAHGMNSGDHVTFPIGPWIALDNKNGTGTLSGRTFSIRVLSTTTFDIVMDNPSTANETYANVTGRPFTRDTHIAGGDFVNGIYYDGKLVVGTTAGEFLTIDDAKVAVRIWDNPTAYSQAGNPNGWGITDAIDFNPFGGKLQAWNGKDKPIDIKFDRTPVAQLIGDPASGGSNAFVPIGRIASSSANYNVVSGIKDKPTILSISAKLSEGVYVGNPNPDDAVEVDIGKVSSAVNPRVIGMAELRNKLIIALRDSLIIGTLGIVHEQTVGSVTSNVHEPDFKDSIPQHGAIAQRSIVSLGNDLFMCDRVGVPSVAQSQQSGQLVPNRVSKLIAPAIQLNLSRLSDETLRLKCFAVYNTRDSQFMLFMPKYDDSDTRFLPVDPIVFLSDLGNNRFAVNVPAHGFDVNDKIIIAGATSVGANPAGQINGTWRVETVIDENTIGIYNSLYTFPVLNISGGGANVTVKPVNEGKVGYVLVYDPELKIKAWSRFTGIDYDFGATSLQGRVFFGKGGKIYEHGTQERPFAADTIGDYDARVWTPGASYSKGYRILDADVSYIVLKDHIASGTGTFAQERTAYPDRWEAYKGTPIKFIWEWPWADFDTRLEIKAIRNVFVDATGKGQFNFNIFVDQLYKDLQTGMLTPVRSLRFTAADAGGFGAGPQPYGTGRRVREQLIWPMPVNGMLHKFRIEGETTDPIRFVAVTVVYNKGTMKR